jgi:hypothetical protein
VGECLKENKCQSLAVLKDKNAVDIDSFLEQLKSIPGVKKITIKSLPEDMSDINRTLRPEFDVGKTIDHGILIEGLKKLHQTVSDLNNILNVCRDDALTLTQGKLVGTMWGAKSMQQVLCGLHNEIAENSTWERVEFFSSMIMKSIERLIHKLSTELAKVCAEEQKIICTVLIPNILTNYEQLRDIASKALVSLSSLIYVDMMFKKMTSYPATWFMNGNMLEDMKQDYQKLLGFMMQVPRIEQGVIYPLDFMKLQYLNKTPT